jgi:hypothetical protein
MTTEKLQRLAKNFSGLITDKDLSLEDLFFQLTSIKEKYKEYFLGKSFQVQDFIKLLFFVFSYLRTGKFDLGQKYLNNIFFVSFFLPTDQYYTESCRNCEGDGRVDFKADSTQIVKEFVWDFGDGTTPVTTTVGIISHTFTKNTNFQVKLSAKNNAGQVSETKAIIINSRLARSIEDVPANELNKIRILHIILGTEKGINPEFEIKNDPFNYLNTVFQQFISNHPQPHNAIYNNLAFENYFYKVNSEDSTYIYNNQDKLIINSRSNFLIDSKNS